MTRSLSGTASLCPWDRRTEMAARRLDTLTPPKTANITFCVRGVIPPPCGVPFSLCVVSPPSSTPALSHFWMSRTTRRSVIRCSTNFTSHSWEMASKEDSTYCPPPPRRLSGAGDHRPATASLRRPSARGRGVDASAWATPPPARASRRHALANPSFVDGPPQRQGNRRARR